MKLELLSPESNLEFGDGGKYHDVRFGIGHYGTYDYNKNPRLRSINVAIIGSDESINHLNDWLALCRFQVTAKESKQPNLFPPFPGFSLEHSFCSRIITDSQTMRSIEVPNGSASTKKLEFNKGLKNVIELYAGEIDYIIGRALVDVVICAPSIDHLKMTTYPLTAGEGILDFHDALKAESLRLRIPIQIVLPATYNESILTKQKKLINRDQQDEATRAWNLHTALYYKAKGVPWRLLRNETDLETCFLGISFFKSLDGKKTYASSAQVFNERGEGVVVVGGIAHEDTDKQIRLDKEGAYNLIKRALLAFWKEHFHYPARMVVHKTSSFSADELAGFRKGFEEKGISKVDFVHLRTSKTRLFRTKDYPTLRGTLWHVGEKEGFLYTKGSVPFYETYPGQYPPQSLYIDATYSQRSLKAIAGECLALTKMNWNSTRFDQKVPITLQAAREVGSILKYLRKADSKNIPPAYRFYM